MRELTVREKIIPLTTEPKITQSEIARRVGRSRERVRQILLSEGIELPKRKWCKACDASLPTNWVLNYCPSCRDKEKKKAREQTWGWYTCSYCGNSFCRLISEAKHSKRLFCNRVCQGRWLGENFGSKHRGKKSEEAKMKYEIVSTEEIPPKAKQQKELDELVKVALELEPGKVLRITRNSRDAANNLKTWVSRRLAVLGYKCSSSCRKCEVFIWDVKKLEG